MTDEEIALLRAVCEHPDDDLPRLIYADWLDDRGDPRGEFLRIECELPHLTSDDPRRRPLHERACAIIGQHKDRWVGPIRELANVYPNGEVRYWDFRRGLLEILDINASALVGPVADCVRWMPIRQLTIRQVRNEHADGLAKCLALRRAKTLELNAGQEPPPGPRSSLTAATLETLLGGIGATGPESLKLYGAFRNDAASVLVRWPGLAQVRTLNLQGNYFSDAGVEVLAACPALQNIRLLDLTHNPVGWGGAANLSARFGERALFTDPGDQPRRRRRVRR